MGRLMECIRVLKGSEGQIGIMAVTGRQVKGKGLDV